VKGKKEKKNGNRVKRRGREESRVFKPSHPPVPSSFAPKPLFFPWFHKHLPTLFSTLDIDPRRIARPDRTTVRRLPPSKGDSNASGARAGAPLAPPLASVDWARPLWTLPPVKGGGRACRKHQRHSSSPGLGAAILPTHGRGALGLYETAQ
jgi:hypothetical protein